MYDGTIIGEVRLFAGNFAPRGWALCHGQLIAISQNTALFSIIGTTYGGDGRDTFALPDLRGRVPVGSGWGGPDLSGYSDGQIGGTESLYLTSSMVMASEDGKTAVSAVSAVDSGTERYNNMQPYLAINYIICLEGNYPSRP